MSVTSRNNRPGPMTPYALMMDVARQMPFVAMIGYFLYTVDARNEKTRGELVAELRRTGEVMTGVVNSNTVVMQRAVDVQDRSEKSLAEILRHVSAASGKRLGE